MTPISIGFVAKGEAPIDSATNTCGTRAYCRDSATRTCAAMAYCRDSASNTSANHSADTGANRGANTAEPQHHDATTASTNQTDHD